jgi:hypothetical protein
MEFNYITKRKEKQKGHSTFGHDTKVSGNGKMRPVS